MDIIRQNTVIASVHPSDDSSYSCKLMGDNLIRINFKLPEAVEFMRGDYIIYRGETFTLNSRPLRKENSTREFEYNCEFQSIDYELTKVEYRLFDNTPIPPQGDFSLMGNARTFMQLLVDNMNRIQTGWTLGEVIDSDFVNLDFSSEDCYTVIGNLSKQFNTEFYITAPKIINLKQKPWTGTVIELSRGKGKGLKNLQELKNDQNKLITSLHVCGGTKNLPSGYRNGATRLQLASGLPLQANTDKYGLIEGSQVFDTIYPRLNAGISPNDPGKVTSVNGLYQFQDANLDFDVNQYLTSETAKVVFNTGELAGYQFDVASYNHATKTFTINPATYENSINLPSDNFKAAVGDKYTLIDIIMPQAYIDRAEAELLTAGQDILPKVSNPPDNYKGDCDPIYFKQNNITISIGQVVRIKSDQLGIDKQKRVIGYTQNMNTPSNYTLEFGELTSGRLQALESNVSSIAKSSVRRSIDAQTSAQEYALAKANLAEVTAKAYADGIVTNEEQRAIDDATAKANAAKAAAISAAADYVDAIKADLQNQIDGNITSWFFDYEPSLANVPAVNWSSDAVRDIHLGDLFYWTSKGYSYRFQKVGSVFSWTRISDTDVTKALADAAKAQDTADSKRRTFIAQPTTPYDIGDLWTQGTAGDIMRCISSRLSGAFVASDWEKAVKYTDDTAVNNLQVGGRNYFANSEIKSTDGWSPYYSTVSILDNSLRVLGNSSFVGVYNYYTQSLDAQKEVTISFFAKNNKSQAANVYAWPNGNGTVNIGTLAANSDWVRLTKTFIPSNYQENKVSAYSIYIFLEGDVDFQIKQIKIEFGNKVTDYTPAPEDVSDDATTKANAAQAAAQEYALAKANLAEVTAKAYADGIVTAEEQRAIADATNKVNAIQVGGRNLLLNSRNVSYNGDWVYVSGLLDNEIITVQLWGVGTIECYISNGYGFGGVINSTGYGKLTYIVRPWITHALNNGTVLLIITGNNLTIKVERGNKPTDWTPAPEDVDAAISEAKAKAQEADYLKAALQGSTDVEGGLLATNVLLMKNAAGAVTGGISGLSSDNVGVWTGGTYAEAIASLAKNILFKNGAFRLAGGDVVYDISQLALTISALIRTAASGERVEISKESNSITIYDSNNVAKMKFAPKNVMAFADISGNVATTTVTYPLHEVSYYDIATVSIGSDETLVLDPTKYYDVTTPRVSYTLNAQGFYDDNTNTNYIGSASLVARLVNTVTNAVVWTRTRSVSSGSEEITDTDSGEIAPFTIIALQGGTYRFDVFLTLNNEGSGSNSNVYASIDAGQTLSATTMINFAEMGLNGFNFINDIAHFLHYGPDIFAYKGNMDIPGVLASGSVSAGAMHNTKWGAKVGSDSQAVTKGGTGIFNVPHNVGSSAYVVIITCLSAGYFGACTAKGTGSFTATIKAYNNTNSDVGFDYIIIGSN